MHCLKHLLNKYSKTTRMVMVVLFALSLGGYCLQYVREARAFTAKTWDGGGTTNNWSEAANWSGDTVPVAGDDVTFDATSTKSVTIDTNINVGSIAIAASYTGTITQSNAASITVTGCSGRVCFVQSGGTFNGSTNTITLNSAGFGGFRMLGGTFNGGSGDINIPNGPAQGADFLLQGGTFKSTSGTLTIAGHPSFNNPGTTFLHNGGTVTLAAVQAQFFSADSDHPSIAFNNLNINSLPGVNYDFGLRMIVLGALTLNEGTIGESNNGSVIEARGAFSVSPNFDGGIGRVEFGPGGSPRTITLAAGIVYPSIRLNDSNLTVNTSGSGTLTMPHQLNIGAGTFNQGGVDMVIDSLGISGGPCLVISGGTFNGSSKTITLNSDGFGTVSMTGGAFNGGSGDITATGTANETNHDLQINGGTFRSTSGNLFVSRAFRFQNGGAFQNNGGTVVFNGGTTTAMTSDDGMGNSPPLVFNNLIYSRNSGSTLQMLANNVIVNGNLSLVDGVIDDAGGFRTIDVRGNVNIASTFDGLTFRITLLFSGAACQTVTLNGTQNFPGGWQTNKTGCGITANGNFGVGSMNVSNGSFVFGNNSQANIVGNMTVDPNGRLMVTQGSDINVGANVTIVGSCDLASIGDGTINISGITTVGGSLTIEGPSGPVDLGTVNIQPGGAVDLDITNNLVTFDSLTVAPGGRFSANGPSSITLAGNVVNNGLINLHDEEGPNCAFGGFVNVQSSAFGTRRLWSGSGVFHMVHVNVVDMGGTSPIRVHGGLNNNNNDVNWTFDSDCSARTIHTPYDFDGDGKSDVGMFRPATGEWWLNRSTLSLAVGTFGTAIDRITPADFDGDGLADLAVWREGPLSPRFFILQSSDGTVRTQVFGLTGDDPRMVGDWDGDGIADPAVFRPATAQTPQATFFYLGSKNNPNKNITFLPWGQVGDISARGDFDGDGKLDPAIFRNGTGDWWIVNSSTGASRVQHWGQNGDHVIDGDFDGDGKSDPAIFRSSGNSWWILLSSNGQQAALPFGLSTDVLTPADFDGDGKTDIAAWRPSTGDTWTIQSSSGLVRVIHLGANGDVPTAASLDR